MRKGVDVSEDIFRSNKLLLELTNHVAVILGDVYPEINRNLSKVSIKRLELFLIIQTSFEINFFPIDTAYYTI